MNLYQEKLISCTNDLPDDLLEQIIQFSEFLKERYKNRSYRERIKASERDIKKGRIKQTTPQTLFKELGI